ncbi:toprim domain-containing protein [Azospirillum sp. SYSU D00513]|uniref:toprim domain-containing protein n=1 Tax=Azospirillum sp. SYSU D00513 TaxID=2812561 RepID=UPI001A969DDD|nr:toprim domain-containing protein [Azospirillum sp. SYSU D00513]
MSIGSTTPLRDRARGRWRSILAQVGIPAAALTGKHGPCPICQAGKDRFRFTDHQGTGAWICNHCGHGTGADLVMAVLGVEFKEAALRIEAVLGCASVEPPREPDVEEQRARMNALWREARPVAQGDPVDQWLRRRGIVLDAFPSGLRTSRSMRCRGMVAKVIGPDGRPVNVHRTFLTDDGRKADLECPRKLMPGPFPPGSAVQLHPATDRLGIAEGIETALSAHLLFGLPVWAALTAGSLQEFRPPPGITSLTIFGDNDLNFVGQSAALTLAKAVHRNGIEAKVMIPERSGTDWNDVLTSAEVAA